MVKWCLLIQEKFINLILSGKKTWEIRTRPLSAVGERIALGNTKTKLIEGFATVAEVKRLTVAEMMRFNDKHFANDYIEEKWSNRPWLYALVLSNVELVSKKQAYPPAHGNPKISLS